MSKGGVRFAQDKEIRACGHRAHSVVIECCWNSNHPSDSFSSLSQLYFFSYPLYFVFYVDFIAGSSDDSLPVYYDIKRNTTAAL